MDRVWNDTASLLYNEVQFWSLRIITLFKPDVHKHHLQPNSYWTASKSYTAHINKARGPYMARPVIWRGPPEPSLESGCVKIKVYSTESMLMFTMN